MDVPGTIQTFDVPGQGRINYPGPALQRVVSVRDQFDQFTQANLRVPSSIVSICLFQVRSSQIARMECFERGAHLGIRTGW
jgi:hypothetical protein